MQYSDYEVEDFMTDASFRNYCLGANAKDVQFWESWLTANPHKFDEAMQAKEMFFLLNGNLRPEQVREDRRLFEAAFQKHLAESGDAGTKTSIPARSKFRLRSILIYTSLAAAAVLGFFFIPKFLVQPSPAPTPLKYDFTQASKAGERKSFQLPDGSKVMLNAGSTLTMAQDFNTKTREVTLEGEAFFDVSHNPGKPFIIHTSSMNVRVLGTVFNVKAYPADKVCETSLLKGSVEITLKNDQKKKIILKPNEKIVLPNLHPEKLQEETKNKPVSENTPDYTIANLTMVDSTVKETSWTENRLVFNDNSFEEIAPELERWYNVVIRIEDAEVKQFRFTATFDQKNITQILDVLKLTRRFEYAIEQNNQILIRKK